MACSLVWRLFRHRPFTRLHSSNPSTPPWAPAAPSSSGLGSQPAAANLKSDSPTDASGSPLIALRTAVLDPDHPFTENDPPFAGSEGYLGFKGVRLGVGPDGHAFYDWVYAFSTAADASSALVDHPYITVAGHQYNLFPYHGDSTEPQSELFEPGRTRNPVALPPPPASDISPPRKRLKKSLSNKKIVCKICFGDIDGPYSTPCRRCKEATCYECLRTQFRTAMKYIDRMPVMCCAIVMHHEVVRGILPTAEVERYKQKFDEFNTIDPLYCPVPTCSAFIPPRMFNQTDRTVTCHVCKTAICAKCRQSAKGEHVCAEDESRQFILKTYEYKVCPNAARDDGVHSEGGDEEPESEQEEDDEMGASLSGPEPRGINDGTQVQAPQDPILLRSTANAQDEAQDTTVDQAASRGPPGLMNTQDNQNGTLALQTDQPASETTVAEDTAAASPENLDNPDENDWEGVSLNFGDEPTDEAWDTWGCRHHFRAFGKDRIPEFWLVDATPAEDPDLRVECMGCFNKVKVPDGEAKNLGLQDKSCHQTPSTTSQPAMSDAVEEEERRTKKYDWKSQPLSECTLCGIIYCRPCTKAARKRMASERAAPDSGQQ
ncbi:hypothetical protein AYO21_02171 [Fonsecaea monophora]|uniref:IBR domain-containing protein n=1 Tax=Fonsecaea monophora TaxID=254056 RepID=A0A177FH53_9EURO|nr:hypothetical protein AYO21_02171 [Fonsecaea monophora]OAG43585.1 hypothetical protein AYO21_02171 [Fonsecaea monophora]